MLRHGSQPNFVFDDSRRALRATVRRWLDLPTGAVAGAHLVRSLNPRRFLVGAVGFYPEQPAALAITDAVWGAPVIGQTPTGTAISSIAETGDYRTAAERAIETILRGGIEKVVLSRAVDIALTNPITAENLAASLRQWNPTGYLYSIPLPDGSHFVGLSPELLISKRGNTIRTLPLAGTARRTGDLQFDAALLLAGAKERHEHQFVVDAIIETLHRFSDNVTVADGPTATTTATMLHLGTPITAELRDPATSAFEVALALHPTPAVCGTPTSQAREVISALEPVDREFFAGAVGWCDYSGDGDWVVAIRSARLAESGRQLRAYAGAGLVRGSNPQAEYDETTTKLGTVLTALGHRPAAAVTGA